MGPLRVEGEADVLLFFFCQSFAGVLDLVAIMNGFGTLFGADGDEQADDDGGDVDEEVSPRSVGVVRWMDF
jgi:hypothetical protein